MIDILTGIWESISSFIHFILNSLSLLASQGKMVFKIYNYFTGYWYLIPGFLVWFALMFTIIFIVNRMTLGRN